ncbi:MAG: tetratricopeptide repeat protein [Candidatus Desulfofervidus auxilii]|nr:tetratricopeptide repeat protein [Candidatus Desulfofervidus auxilii]
MVKQEKFEALKKLIQSGNLIEAEQAILEAMLKEPEEHRYKFLLAELALKRNTIEKAERLCKEALSKLPTERYGLFLKGKILLAKGTKKAAKEAMEIFEYLFNQSKTKSTLYWLLQAYLKAKEPKKAWEILQSVPFSLQDTPALRLLQAKILIALKRYKEALKVYELLLKESPQDMKLKRKILLLKKQIKGKEKWQKEMEIIARLPSAEKDIILLLAQAETAKEQGKIKEAISFYEKVLKIDPENREANLNLGFVLIKSEDPNLIDAGIEKLKQFFLEEPYFHPVRSALFSACERYGKIDYLLRILEDALNLHPEKVKIFGWIKRYQKKIKNAAHC